MILTLTLLLSTLVAGALLLSALVPTRAVIRLGAAVNVVQLHTLSILGIYPSLAFMSWLALWRSILGSPLWRWPWMQALLALAIVQAVSIAWSPTPLLGVRYLLYLLPLPFVAHAMYALAREQPELARSCMKLLVAGAALEAVIVIFFRLAPAAEIAFLRHASAGFFVSPNTLDALFHGSRNNVLDPSKAGGFFVNANIAATYLGMSAITAWYLGRVSRSALLRGVAVLCWLAVFFTGSKAGLLCALALPIGLATLSAVRARQANPYTLFAATLALAVAAVALALPLAQEIVDDYRYNTLATLGSREDLWAYAVQMIGERPLTGLGFGGWEQRFAVQAFLSGSTTAMPPHNSLFILWLQSGLAGVIAGLALLAAVYAAIARALSAADRDAGQLALAAAGAFTWYVVQGLGENFGLVGEVHMTPLVGALLGLVCARCDALETHEHSHRAVRGAAAPSALPAV
jgi:O-antigen ligase